MITVNKAAMAVIALLVFMPGQLLAQTCPAQMSIALDTVGENDEFMIGEEIPIKLTLDSRGIADGVHVDFNHWTYKMDCGFGQTFDSCTAQDNTVVYVPGSASTTTCTASDGTAFPPSTIVVTPSGIELDFNIEDADEDAIQIGTPNTTCEVDFKVRVDAVDEDLLPADIIEIVGWVTMQQDDSLTENDVECHEDDSSEVSASSGSQSIGFSINPGDATFIVTKDFTDNNPDEVTIHLDCNAGYPHAETTEIIDPATGTFKTIQIWQVFNYPTGFLDCRIWEEPVPVGYEESYDADALDGIAEIIEDIDPDDDAGDTGCFYTNIDGGTFTCEITNTLEPTSMVVKKEWFWDEEFLGEELPNLYALADWQCFNVRTSPSGGLVMNGPSGTLSFEGETDSELITPIYADWGGSSYCTAVERPIDSVVETDSSDCDEVSVLINTRPSCTIYNTVFLYGVPTLSKQGLALLVLLMLGVGAVGFRRFA